MSGVGGLPYTGPEWVGSVERRITTQENRKTPRRLASTQGAVPLVDADDARSTGWYYADDSTLNMPPGESYGNWFVEVQTRDADAAIQFARPHAYQEALYMRRLVSGGWQAWTPMMLETRSRPAVLPLGITLGNGIATLVESFHNGLVTQHLRIKFGSTTTMDGPDLRVETGHPDVIGGFTSISGEARMSAQGNPAIYTGHVIIGGSTARIRVYQIDGTNVVANTIGPSNPFTWGENAWLEASWAFPIV